MANEIDPAELAPTAPGPTSDSIAALDRDSHHRPLIAPAWHTALIVILAAATSIAGARGAHHLTGSRHGSNLSSYLASIAMEWVLAAVVFLGLRSRRTSLRTVYGEPGRSSLEWISDAGAAIAFWFIALMVLWSLAFALKPLHLHPENIRSTVSKLAPFSLSEMFAWTVLSISAGICEEFIFRGYLQQQFTRMSHRLWMGVLGSALVFGFAHGYEGLSGMLLITAFGALFSVFRLMRGNLRAGMMAHAWHDFFSGMVLSILAHHKMLPLG